MKKNKFYIFLMLLIGIAFILFKSKDDIVFFVYNFFDQKDYNNHSIIKDLEKKLDNKKNVYYADKINLFNEKIKKLNIAKIDYNHKTFSSKTIINDKISKDRLKTFLDFLNKKVELAKNNSFSFFIILDDASSLFIQGFDLKQVPILIADMDKETFREDILYLVPDFYLISKCFDKKMFRIKKLYSTIKFEDKIDKAFWRGSQTGGQYSMDTKNNLPRYKLVELSLDFPHYVDARFTSYTLQTENSESGRNYIKYMENRFGSNPENNFTSKEKQVEYKYIVSLDGNVSAWERIFHALESGSILLYNTKYVQFFTPYMVENVHYVPIKDDLSDLIKKIDFLRSHQEIASSIIENGKKFVSSFNSVFFASYYSKVLNHIQNNYSS